MSGNDLMNDSSLASMIDVDVAEAVVVVNGDDNIDDIGSAIAGLLSFSLLLLLLLLLVVLLPPRM